MTEEVHMVHPAFDPTTKTWFVTVPKCEAPCFGELLDKLNARGDGVYQALDFYRGAGVPLSVSDAWNGKGGGWVPPPDVRVTRPVRDLGVGFKPPKKVAKPKEDPKPKEPRPPVVRRGSCGPRLWARTIPHELRERVLNMWASGMEGPKIAAELGITPAKVAAHIVAPARKQGDPRAVARGSVGISRNRKADVSVVTTRPSSLSEP